MALSTVLLSGEAAWASPCSGASNAATAAERKKFSDLAEQAAGPSLSAFPLFSSIPVSYRHSASEPAVVGGLGSLPTAFCHPFETVPPQPHLMNLASILASCEARLQETRFFSFDEAKFQTKHDRDKEKVRAC